MGSFHKRMVETVALIAALVPFASAQNTPSLPSDFGTPQRSARLASTAGFIDILGIKLGMPAETALPIVKSNNPTARITFERTADYEGAWISNLPRTDPSRQFVYEIDVQPTQQPGDQINIGITVPPSKQVVHSIARQTVLPAPVAIANIVDGLRKKYGPETAGVDFKWRGLNLFDAGGSKTLLWVFDTEGRRIPLEKVADKMNSCTTTPIGGMGGPEVSIRRSNFDSRIWSPDKISSPCYPYVVLTAAIQVDGAVQPGLNGATRSFTISTYDWPLVINSANAFYAFLDQSAQRDAMRAQQQAQQRGKDIKY